MPRVSGLILWTLLSWQGLKEGGREEAARTDDTLTPAFNST
jgi:hypothetical protein